MARSWVGFIGFIGASLGLLGACGDNPDKRRPLGSECELGSECSSGLCASGMCVDPKEDEDVDGLTNGLEVELGTDVFDPDTDGDGVGDRAELDARFQPQDSDGDGKQDAVESAIADGDHDCVTDQLDKRDNTSDGASDPRVAELCPPAAGVCVAHGAAMRVACPVSLDAPECDLGGVPDYEATETSCDAKDNDCDGATDEGCDPLLVGLIGHWKLDGDGQDAGPYGDHGTVTGAVAAPDRFGHANQALRFSVAGDRVVVAQTHHPKDEVTASYSVWVRPDRPGAAASEVEVNAALGVFSFGDVLSKNKRSGLVLNGERHCAEYVGESNDQANDRACTPAAHWSHVVIVKHGRDVSFWLDGRLHGTAQLAAGQDLDTTGLAIGVSKDNGDGTFYEPFHGAIDDLRVWDRAIGPTEIGLLFGEGGWAAAGSAANPAQSCLHVRDAGRGEQADAPASGSYTLDVDGDGARAPFEAWCDMDLDGGGWTLAWVYGFTAFDTFDAPENAVTPIPSWPVTDVTVPVSTTPPSSPTTPGAIDWALWKELGRSFAVVSDLNDGVVCEPGAGSLSDGLDGWLDCKTAVDVTQTCQGVVPSGVYFGRYGPSLYATDLYYYFDGNEADNWPTHDPCGANSPQQVAAPAREGGAIYLRETDRAIEWPAQCDYVSGLQRVDGVRRIDPDGVGGLPAFDVACDFTTERGGWTRLSDAMRSSIDRRPEVAREVLYARGDAFYRSPSFTGPWSDAWTAVAGRWLWSGAGGDGAAACAGDGAGGDGIGCVDAGGFGVAPDGPLAGGSIDVCQAEPDAFDAGATCTEAEVWVRENACAPDAGSLLGDGELDQVAAAAGSWESPCWYAFGPGGWLDAFTADDDVPPGGRAPSLKVDNPVLGNDLWAVELGHTQLAFIAGRSYTLSFWAKASAARTLRAFVQSRDLVRVTHEDLAIGTTWAQYEVRFTATTTMWDAMVNLQLGEVSTATLWLDGFKLVEE